MEKILEQFASKLASRKESLSRKAMDFDKSENQTKNQKVDFRQLCIDNQLTLFPTTDADNEALTKKIDMFTAVGYYSKTKLKAKELQQVLDAKLHPAAAFTYYLKKEQSIATQGSSSSTTYECAEDVASAHVEEALTNT